MMRVRDLLAASCALRLAAACPFGGDGPLPAGHPEVGAYEDKGPRI